MPLLPLFWLVALAWEVDALVVALLRRLERAGQLFAAQKLE